MKWLLLILFATPALADTCPPPPDHRAAVDDLLAQSRRMTSEGAAQPIWGYLWALWREAPDAAAQAVLDKGIRMRESYDFVGAKAEFDRLVEYCPDYAEGYNQRAFVAFLRQDYKAALIDLDRALELSPNHLAAMTGRVLTLMGLGDEARAQIQLRQAMRLNPWVPERHLLKKVEETDL